MTPELWRKVGPHLDHVLDLDSAARTAWLADLRAREPELAREIEELLDEHGSLDLAGFLAGDAAQPSAAKSLEGLVVGAYTLREPLGQGGMGQVWLAERSDGRFEGLAAVKLLYASLMGRDAEARFSREGSFLARLRHPGIAQLIDAGTTSAGQPYLVLELIEGEPIDAYCDARRLSVEARLELFLDVLSAIGFAHANLVVHRDLKPPNILVDRGGRVKLLDFGIAKLLDAEDGPTAAAPLTREGQSMLTPEYAAPEQLSGGTITTSTDVYALGLVLYVLLTGKHPGGASTASPLERIRSVVERDVARPSSVVATVVEDSPEPPAERAARRASTPERLRRLLRGDLDNIVARALRREPAERYASVGALAEDIRRYLRHEPVTARADSLAYRAAKFVRRNRGSVAAAGLVLAAILAGTLGIAWQAGEARRQRDAAETQLARTTAANDFISHLLGVAAPSGKSFTVGELLDEGEALIERQFAHDDMLHAEMLVVIGKEFMLSERWERATPILERAAALVERSPDPGLRARVLCPLAFLKMINHEAEGARAMIDRALAELPATESFDLQRAECLIRQAEFGYFDGDGASMIRRSTEALALIGRSRTPSRIKEIDGLGTLAHGYYLARESAKAEQTFARVFEALEQVGRDRTVAAADMLNNWSLLYFQGDIAKAEPLCRRMVELRRSIEGGGSIAPTPTFNYAAVLLELGRHDEARALFEETIRAAAVRAEQRIQIDAMMQLADLEVETGELERGAALLDTVESTFGGTPHFDRFRQVQMGYYRGRLAEARGDTVASRDHYAEAVEIFARAQAKIAMNVRALIGLARSELALGDTTAATTAAEEALALAESFVEPGAPSYLVGLAQAMRGEILLARGTRVEARAAFEGAARHLERTLGPQHPATRNAVSRAAS